MNNLGNKIQKLCYWVAGILLVIGFVLACIAAKNAVYLYIADFEDIMLCVLAFFRTFVVYFGIAVGLFCFGAIFGYLNKIYNSLEYIKEKLDNKDQEQETLHTEI